MLAATTGSDSGCQQSHAEEFNAAGGVDAICGALMAGSADAETKVSRANVLFSRSKTPTNPAIVSLVAFFWAHNCTDRARLHKARVRPL